MKSTGASQRAAEVASAMLSVPGYADDTMLFMMRYGTTARETLRKVDWDEFQARLSALNKHWFASRRRAAVDGEASCTAAAAGDGTTTTASTAAAADAVAATEAQEATELRARTLELVQDFPPLVRDFDKFVDCTRIMAMRYGRVPQ
ncbi:hypothetical protein HDV57DRAFT_501249 [Trichoderma longibrachiatum]|uniref:Uncharacterized protein n=1 Tax=Trichoderma longibrachiatum ATCC 18648 TaxID=983965 RepID=A0A2T4C707_TRILO|nr:hypothetical protein M440DRAFT_1400208 [Trichoderma longibrachiatum ATCC 18648]